MSSEKAAIGMIFTGGFGLILNFMGVPGYGDIGLLFINALSATPSGAASQIAGTLHSLSFSMQIASIFGDWIIPIFLVIAGIYALAN